MERDIYIIRVVSRYYLAKVYWGHAYIVYHIVFENLHHSEI
jgi:hypothetical protein